MHLVFIGPDLYAVCWLNMICILYGLPCEMDSLATRWDSETNGKKSISHEKPYKMHYLAYCTFQGTSIALRKVEDHENHVRWIYLTTVLYMGKSEKYARNCYRDIIIFWDGLCCRVKLYKYKKI